MRLFFALRPAQEISVAICERVAPVAAELDVQLVPMSNLHATLLFLGAVEPERLDAVRAVAASIRGACGELRFDALDVWEKPRVLCAVSSEPAGPASVLADALRDAIVAAGFAPDLKPFRPHLTLARKVPLDVARKHSWPRELDPGFVVRYENFVLMASRREEHRSIYSVVDSWPLYGAKEH